jgi:uncharacterized membrane protein YfcA
MIFLIGLLIGFSLSLTGAGGAVFAVPLLVLLLALPMSEAIGLALATVALGAGLGALVYWYQKRLLWLPALSFAGGGLLTAPLGKLLGNQLPDVFLLSGFSLLALAIAWRMWKAGQQQEGVSRLFPVADKSGEVNLSCRFSKSGQLELKPRCLSVMIGGGLGVGLLSGLFGVGGGFLIVPLIMYQTGVAMPMAVGSSLFSVTIISSSAFVTHVLSTGGTSSVGVMPLGLSVLVGILAGFLLSSRINGRWLQTGFAVSLVLVIMVTLLDYFLSNTEIGKELGNVIASIV